MAGAPVAVDMELGRQRSWRSPPDLVFLEDDGTVVLAEVAADRTRAEWRLKQRRLGSQIRSPPRPSTFHGSTSSSSNGGSSSGGRAARSGSSSVSRADMNSRRRRAWPRLLSRVPAASSASSSRAAAAASSTWRRLVGARRKDGRGHGFVTAGVVVAALPSSPAPTSPSPFSLCPAFAMGVDVIL
uniref:Uncharacterized protein n=1 Tax=Oryza nivara TaxID=4536 RepID=A0A0E0FSS0_ORYNI